MTHHFEKTIYISNDLLMKISRLGNAETELDNYIDNLEESKVSSPIAEEIRQSIQNIRNGITSLTVQLKEHQRQEEEAGRA